MLAVLTAEQKTTVVEETDRYIQLACKLYELAFPAIDIHFDLTGHTIGMYKRLRLRRFIRYNPTVFAKYFDANLRETVPHEVAHYIVDMRFKRKNIRPHGVQWREVMSDFGVEANRTAMYDLSDIPKRQYSTVAYTCRCQRHELGIRRHNKLLRKEARYSCRRCGELLKPL